MSKATQSWVSTLSSWALSGVPSPATFSWFAFLQGENGASLARKKMGGKVPKETAGEGPKAKAPVPPKGTGSKREPAPLAGKAKTSKGLRKPGIPTKSSASKAASKKAEAEG